jgi:hypothetical protein
MKVVFQVFGLAILVTGAFFLAIKLVELYVPAAVP